MSLPALEINNNNVDLDGNSTPDIISRSVGDFSPSTIERTKAHWDSKVSKIMNLVLELSSHHSLFNHLNWSVKLPCVEAGQYFHQGRTMKDPSERK